MNYQITDRLAESVRRYLGTRPHDEVAPLVAMMNAEILPQVKTELEQCRDSGQMEASDLVAHKRAGDL